METVALILLILHIGAGSIALLTAFVALVTAKGGVNHVRSGRVYAIAMTIIFLTAFPLALLTENIFLLFIAVFSFYMVFAGWRFARNRQGRPQTVDWAAVAVMALTGLAMWGYAGGMVLKLLPPVGAAHPVTLALFGFIALGLSLADALYHRTQRTQRTSYAKRISRHLTNMMGGTIATITAVLVVNVPDNIEPQWIFWVLPTIVITPLIIWWNIRINRRRTTAVS